MHPSDCAIQGRIDRRRWTRKSASEKEGNAKRSAGWSIEREAVITFVLGRSSIHKTRKQKGRERRRRTNPTTKIHKIPIARLCRPYVRTHNLIDPFAPENGLPLEDVHFCEPPVSSSPSPVRRNPPQCVAPKQQPTTRNVSSLRGGGGGEECEANNNGRWL